MWGWGRKSWDRWVGIEGVEVGGVEVGGLESGRLGSAKLWLGDEVRRVRVEEVGVGEIRGRGC